MSEGVKIGSQGETERRKERRARMKGGSAGRGKGIGERVEV